MKVKWATDDIDVLVQAVLHYPAIRVTQAKIYYQKQNRQDVVDRIAEARRLAAIIRMENKINKLKDG